MDEFTRHYMSQAGGGAGEETTGSIGQVYKASFVKGQKGRGALGTLFSRLADWASPLFKSGVQSLGREALKTGTDILQDASQARTSGELKEITSRRLTEGRDRLAQKMQGTGRRRRRRRRGTKKTKKALSLRQKGMGRKKRGVRRGARRTRRSTRLKADIFGGYK